MTKPKAKTRKAHVLKNFNDAGSGASFKKGDKPNIEEGAFANYVAAGLIRDPDATTTDTKGAAPAS